MLILESNSPWGSKLLGVFDDEQTATLFAWENYDKVGGRATYRAYVAQDVNVGTHSGLSTIKIKAGGRYEEEYPRPEKTSE